MLIYPEMSQILSPLSFPLNGGRTKKCTSQNVPASKRKADGVIEASSEEEGERMAKAPRTTDTQVSSFSLHEYLLPGTVLILPSQ